ncbi:MAG: hypothetical protein NVSMB51_12650 [Solirubrobacteraceae bacterium]
MLIGLAGVVVLAGCGAHGPPAVSVDPQRTLNDLRGKTPLGVGLDGHGRGEITQIYTRRNERAMLSAGLGPLAYRLRTELGSEAWHWNASGSFSDARCRCGYWTSSDRPGRRQIVAYGYRLPRRGNTIDQANNDGYSRIDDGDPRSYWKSNPYLGDNPQWVMVDLGSPHEIDRLALDWGDPFPRRFLVQIWRGSTPPARYGAEHENAVFAHGVQGAWQTLTGAAGHAGRQRVRAGPALNVRYLRIFLQHSSGTGPRGDARGRRGFALRELRVLLGVHDWVRHGRGGGAQSVIWVSSTDPWHRASDRDLATEQPSFDTVYRSSLARGQPVLIPVALAYGTPEDAAAQLRWLRRRGYPVAGLELGEEPDGQLIGPEDYATLYAAFARALPGVRLGGPGFASAVPDWSAWPDGHRTSSWTARLLAELGRRGVLGRLNFFSFEWYPFDDVCASTAAQLRGQAELLRAQIARQYADGLPRGMPLAITEYGYSPFAAQAEVELTGGLIDADILASFLALGGSSAYLYGYEPDQPIRESKRCSSFGNLALLLGDGAHRALKPLASYHAMRLLAHRWIGSRIVGARSPFADVAAYASDRGGGHYALLLINRSDAPRRLRAGLRGPLREYLLGPAQYAWHSHGALGYPDPDLPPAASTVDRSGTVELPPRSLAVITN